mmetsp:Transcript_15552/g.17578  ORF Transcript_15552/g.17578 Transcript_15552/m.17578 type:complete len:274 (+) Transcript_15552:154-975(+)
MVGKGVPLRGATINLFLSITANYLQHIAHPTNEVLENVAAKNLGRNWREENLFRVGTGWTAQHELMSQTYSGRFVYLSVLVLFLQLIYSVFSFIVELFPLREKYARRVYACAALVNGLAIVTGVLFTTIAIVHEYHVKYREQWDFFETTYDDTLVWGVKIRWYALLMYAVHMPLLLAPYIDITTKRPHLLHHATPSSLVTATALTFVNIGYHVWLRHNYIMNNGAIPYPWYYDIKDSIFALTAYLLVVNGVIGGVAVAIGNRLRKREGIKKSD